MAEALRQEKTGSDIAAVQPKMPPAISVFRSSLTYILIVMSAAVAGNQAHIAAVLSSDLSQPLWGGGIASLSEMPQTEGLLNDRIKLHHFDELPCGSCHTAPAMNPGSAETQSSSWSDGVDVNRSCTSFGCHQYDEKMNHPIDVPLPVGVASEQSFTVTCLSCHQLQESVGVDGGQQLEWFLQDPEIVGCGSCHEKIGGSMKQRSHWKFSQTAHLVPLTPGAMQSRSSADFGAWPTNEIDGESTACLSCHDEVTVTIPGMNETPREKAERFRGMTDHPIGMNYQYIQSQSPMYFNSLMGRQDRIRMFDGRVGCGSCHSLYSDIPGNLTAEYKGSVLCRTCHNR